MRWARENLRQSNRHAKLWVFPVTGAARGPFFDGFRLLAARGEKMSFLVTVDLWGTKIGMI